MRSHSANNFQAEDLPEVMRICRAYGLKAYLTLNITLYGEELDEARRVLDLAKETGVNAVIASDMACILYAREIGLEVHISTQLSISNVEALRFYAQFADVVVLARELRLEQVKEIYETIVREHITGPSGNLVRIEMFAHGAFCMAVSGKCYLSLAAYGESANRGACMQVCRRGYHVTDEETGFDLVVDNKYIMSPKDLCTIEFMDKIIDAGVKVFKIEGRARAADYRRRVQPRLLGRLLPGRPPGRMERRLRQPGHPAPGVHRQGHQLVQPHRCGRDPRRDRHPPRRRRNRLYRQDHRLRGDHGR